MIPSVVGGIKYYLGGDYLYRKPHYVESATLVGIYGIKLNKI